MGGNRKWDWKPFSTTFHSYHIACKIAPNVRVVRIFLLFSVQMLYFYYLLKGTVSHDFNRPNLVSKEISWEVTTALNGFADSCARRNEQNSRFTGSHKVRLLLCKDGAGGKSMVSPTTPVSKRMLLLLAPVGDSLVSPL